MSSPPWLNSPPPVSTPVFATPVTIGDSPMPCNSGSLSPELDPAQPPSQQLLNSLRHGLATPSAPPGGSAQSSPGSGSGGKNLFDRLSLKVVTESDGHTPGPSTSRAVREAIPKVRLKLTSARGPGPSGSSPTTLIFAQPQASTVELAARSQPAMQRPRPGQGKRQRGLKIRLMKSSTDRNLWTSSPATGQESVPNSRPSSPSAPKLARVHQGISSTPPPTAALMTGSYRLTNSDHRKGM